MAETSKAPQTDPFAALAERTSRRDAFDPPSVELLDQIRTDLQTGGAQKRPATKGARLVASAVLLLVGLLSTSLKALAAQPAALLSGGVLAAVVLGALVLSGFIPGGQWRLRLEARRGVLTVLMITFAVVLGVRQSESVPLAEFLSDAHLSGALSCSLHCLWTGGLCLAGLLFIWRKTDPFNPGMTGALMGIIGGLVGNLGVGLACSSLEALHLLFGHGLSVLVLGGLGWLWGRRVLAP